MHLYSIICLPCMLYGCELWAVTKIEMEMLERSHRKILHTIQGLSLHCPNSGLLAVIGALITTKKLLFVHSIVSLPEHSLPCQVLLERLQAPNAKAWLPSILASSDSLNLPLANDLLQQAPSKSVWKRAVSGIIRVRAKTNLLKEAERKCSLHLLTQMNQRPGTPFPYLDDYTQQGPHNQDKLQGTTHAMALRQMLPASGREKATWKWAPPPAGSACKAARTPPTLWLHAPPSNWNGKSYRT